MHVEDKLIAHISDCVIAERGAGEEADRAINFIAECIKLRVSLTVEDGELERCLSIAEKIARTDGPVSVRNWYEFAYLLMVNLMFSQWGSVDIIDKHVNQILSGEITAEQVWTVSVKERTINRALILQLFHFFDELAFAPMSFWTIMSNYMAMHRDIISDLYHRRHVPTSYFASVIKCMASYRVKNKIASLEKLVNALGVNTVREAVDLQEFANDSSVIRHAISDFVLNAMTITYGAHYSCQSELHLIDPAVYSDELINWLNVQPINDAAYILSLGHITKALTMNAENAASRKVLDHIIAGVFSKKACLNMTNKDKFTLAQVLRACGFDELVFIANGAMLVRDSVLSYQRQWRDIATELGYKLTFAKQTRDYIRWMTERMSDHIAVYSTVHEEKINDHNIEFSAALLDRARETGVYGTLDTATDTYFHDLFTHTFKGRQLL